MFENFDFKLLDDPEFKEDSVREEIIVPLINELGYSASGQNRIVRSRKLEHPFVSIGSSRSKVSIIPDYLFLVAENPFLVLDAKSPTENIIKTKHCEQVYSYAIHPDVRAKYYAVCNGKEFLLYYISQLEPLLHFEMRNINKHFQNLKKFLHPDILANHELMNYTPDFGIHLLKLGKKPGFLYMPLMVHTKSIMKVSNHKYTIYTTISSGEGEQEFLASFDFDYSSLEQLIKILPKTQTSKIQLALDHASFMIDLETEEFLFGIVSELSNEIYKNNEEQYAPFIVKQFIPYGG